jgi:hypothetical protein
MKKAIIKLKFSLKLILAICLTFLFFIILYFQLTNTPFFLKEALSLTFSLASILSTLVAAYIALIIYDGWRLTHNKTVDKEIVFGVISNLNTFLLETQHFHNSICQVVSSSKLRQFNLNDEEYISTINYLRQVIRKHEDSIANVANNYSDLESVMSEDTYKLFLTHFKFVIEPAMLVHESFIKLLNEMREESEATPDFIEIYFTKFQMALDLLNTDENGIIVRLKAIKKELANFYRA